MQLRKFRIRLGKIHHVFISHLHGDHTFGLFGLISTFSLLGREEPLHIFGPDGLEDMLLDHMKHFRSESGYELIFHKIQCRRSARIFEDGNLKVISLPLLHRIPTCGFLFREKPGERNIRKEAIEEFGISIRDIVRIKKGEDYLTGEGILIPNSEITIPPFRTRSYAYCSDTRPVESIPSLIKDVDLLYHEATFSHEDVSLAHETYHTTSVQAAEIAMKAGAGKLLIGHFSSRYKDVGVIEREARSVFRETVAVSDGDVYSVERLRQSE